MEDFDNDWEPYDLTSAVGNSIKLWNPKAFIAISVFFSFLPAAILYSLNYDRLGQMRKRNISLIVSLVVFAAAIFLTIISDNRIMKYVFYGLNIGLGIFMQNDQIGLYNSHIQSGGQKASYLVPVIICVFATTMLIFFYIKYSGIPDQKKDFNGDELYYTDNVSIDDVNKLGNFLVNNNIFTNDGKTFSFKLDKKNGIYIFSVIVSKETAYNEDYLTASKQFAQLLSSDVFHSPVEFAACDNKYKPIKTIKS